MQRCPRPQAHAVMAPLAWLPRLGIAGAWRPRPRPRLRRRRCPIDWVGRQRSPALAPRRRRLLGLRRILPVGGLFTRPERRTHGRVHGGPHQAWSRLMVQPPVALRAPLGGPAARGFAHCEWGPRFRANAAAYAYTDGRRRHAWCRKHARQPGSGAEIRSRYKCCTRANFSRTNSLRMHLDDPRPGAGMCPAPGGT